MHYIIGDIHNELNKLSDLLNQIALQSDDEVYVLGDVFDRGVDNADPLGVYYELLKLRDRFHWIRGNHDEWLARYIMDYYSYPARKRTRLAPYHYNTFSLLSERMVEVDLKRLAEKIMTLPLLEELSIGENKYLLAHARTSKPGDSMTKAYYLMGNLDLGQFFIDGIDGYTSFCGHTVTSNISNFKGSYLDTPGKSIWENEKKNVYIMDCGSGFAGGKLAAMCIETGQRFYA